MEQASGKPIATVMNSWTKQMGFPIIAVKQEQVGLSLPPPNPKYPRQNKTQRDLLVTPRLFRSKHGDDRVLNISQKKFCASGPQNGKCCCCCFFPPIRKCVIPLPVPSFSIGLLSDFASLSCSFSWHVARRPQPRTRTSVDRRHSQIAFFSASLFIATRHVRMTNLWAVFPFGELFGHFSTE